MPAKTQREILPAPSRAMISFLHMDRFLGGIQTFGKVFNVKNANKNQFAAKNTRKRHFSHCSEFN
jgi:hypothetical protein